MQVQLNRFSGGGCYCDKMFLLEFDNFVTNFNDELMV